MLKSKDLGEAIKEAINLKIASGAVRTKKEIAAHFGVQPPSLHDWIKNGTIGKEKLPELWRYFSDVVGPSHWGFNQYPGTDFVPPNPDTHALSKQPRSVKASFALTVNFELYDIQASAGPGRTIKEHPQVLRQVSVLESWARQTLGNRDFSNIKLITANGTSMQGTIDNGDVLFVDVSVKQFDGDGIYVISRSDELHVKRLQRLHGMRLAIISDNKSNKTETLNAQEANEVIICGRVLAAWNLKRLWM